MFMHEISNRLGPVNGKHRSSLSELRDEHEDPLPGRFFQRGFEEGESFILIRDLTSSLI